MRNALAAAVVIGLVACGAVLNPPEAGPQAVTGDYVAFSNTARGITGNMSVERAGVLFSSGVVLFTRTVEQKSGADVISRSGLSYAGAAVGPGDLLVELRRVTEQTVPEGRVGLCGAAPVEYVALAHNTRASRVTLLVFTGAEPPGPQANDSRVCATFAYTAPDGARTRDGVVL